MKTHITRKLLIVSICLFMPVIHAAEPDSINLHAIDQLDINKHSFYRDEHHLNKSDVIQIIQQGNDNQASVDVSGRNNQLSLSQEGNRNNGDIQLNGDRNKILAAQDGNGLGFGLKVEGDNHTYTITQQKR